MRPLETLVKQEDLDWEPVAGDGFRWARMGRGAGARQGWAEWAVVRRMGG